MKQTILSVFVAVAATVLTLAFFAPTPEGGGSTAAAPEKESAYDRVMRTGTLRCGYFVWPPHFTADPNTGEKGGAYHDVIETLGRTLNLKIEWVQEYVFGTQVEALRTNKIDALCADGPWTRSAMPHLTYSKPYYFVPGYLYANKDNPKIKDHNDLTYLNSPEYSFTNLDGDGGEEFTRELFPNVKRVSVPSSADSNAIIQNILIGKADFMWNDPLTIDGIPEDQKNRLVVLRPSKPIGVFPFVMSIKKGEDDFVRLLDQGIDVMRDQGALEQILQKHDPKRIGLFMPAPGYTLPPQN